MSEAAAAKQSSPSSAERTTERPGEREGDNAGKSVTRLHSLVGNGAVGRLLRNANDVDGRLAVVRAELARTGEPLDETLRADAERELGAQLPDVRIHRAPVAAAAVNATAFTVGGDVVLGADVPALESSRGRRVLLHELVHVLQQQRSAAPSLALVPPGAPAEKQASPPTAPGGGAATGGIARITERDVTRLSDAELDSEYELTRRWIAEHPTGADHDAGVAYMEEIEQELRQRNSTRAGSAQTTTTSEPPAHSDTAADTPAPTATGGGSSTTAPPAPRSAAEVFSDALSRRSWSEAARALAEMTPADRRAELDALTPEARSRLRTASAELDPSPTNPVLAETEAPTTQLKTDNAEIPDPRGMGYATILKNAGPASKEAVRALASVELPVSSYFPLSEKPIIPNIEAWKKLEAPVRKSILALEPYAAGTACAGWFDVMRANDPGPKPTLTPDQEREANAAYYGSTRETFLEKKVESAKAELPTLGYMDVDAKWKENKYGLITAAQAPNHGIKADTLHAIWTNYWSDKYRIAREIADTCERRLWTVQADAENPTLEADLKKAQSVTALADVMFENSVDALEICRAADAQGKSLTLNELNERVIDHAKFMEGMQILALALSMGGGGGAGGVKGEPVKAEPVKAEPVKVEPVDMSLIGAPTEPPQFLDSADFTKINLKPGQDALYILRDAEGNILKVGKTSAAGAKGRFAVYKRAGVLTGKELRLEVHPLKPSGRTAESYEKALRAKMESGGHAMPWDNTGGRLGRPGFGTPGEGVRTPRVSKERMIELLRLHKGNLREVGKDLGVHGRTVDLWAKAYDLHPRDFR